MSKLMTLLAALLLGSTVYAIDYIQARKDALELGRNGKHAEAVEAFKAMAEAEGVTDFQKSDAMELAVIYLLAQRKQDEAMEMAKAIPLEPESKVAQMRVLDRQRDWDAIVEQFGEEDISSWPDHVKADAYSFRGTAAFRAGKADLAVSDLENSVIYMHNMNTKSAMLNTIGDVYRILVKDNAKAIEWHTKALATGHLYKSADAAISLSNIYLEQGDVDKAMEAIEHIQLGKYQGDHWPAHVRIAKARVLTAAGQPDKARQLLQEVVEMEKVQERLLNEAKAALEPPATDETKAADEQ